MRSAQPRDHDATSRSERRRERMADRDRERVGGVVGVGISSSARIAFTIRCHLLLVGAAVAADRLLDPRRRVLSAGDAGGRRGDEHGSPRLPDGECDAGVCADVRLLQRDGIRRVLRDQRLRRPSKIVSSRASGRSRGGRSPPPVARGPEAPVAFVDDPVPACSRPWVDAENLHDDTLGSASDVPAICRPRLRPAAGVGHPVREHRARRRPTSEPRQRRPRGRPSGSGHRRRCARSRSTRPA